MDKFYIVEVDSFIKQFPQTVLWLFCLKFVFVKKTEFCPIVYYCSYLAAVLISASTISVKSEKKLRHNIQITVCEKRK